MAAPGRVRADEPAAVAAQLVWRGPASCAEPTGVLERARELSEEAWPAESSLGAQVDVEEREGGGVVLRFVLQRDAGAVRRTLELGSCEEARQAAALLLALSLDAETSQQAPAAEAPEVAPPPPQQPPLPPSAAAPVVVTNTPNTPPPDDEDEDEDEPEPAESALAPLLGLAVGVEGPAPSPVSGMLAASGGLRWHALSLELAGYAWLPAQAEIDAVTVRVQKLGGALTACYFVGFSAWELGPCAGLHLERVAAQLDGSDAGAQAWLRAAPGARLLLWLSGQLALGLSADVLLSLHRPRFELERGTSAEASLASVAASAGVVWRP